MLDVPAGITAAINSGSVRSCLMVSIDMETPIFITSHYKDIDFNGDTYDSSPHIESMSDILQTGLSKNPRATLVLSGVDQTYYSLFMNNHYINRDVTIMIGFLSENDEIIDEPL